MHQKIARLEAELAEARTKAPRMDLSGAVKLERASKMYRKLNQTTQDWHRGALFETTVLRVSLWFRHHQKAAKVTKFVTRRFFPSSSELTGCHRSVRMSCGLI